MAYLVAYDGTLFQGFSGGVYSVEWYLRRALKVDKLAKASRTDPGVSALWNVVSVDLPNLLHPGQVKLPRGLWIWAYAEVDEDFNPRKALSREYVYLMPKGGIDVNLVSEAAREFEGTHDFKCYVVRRGEGTSTLATLYRVDVEDLGDFLAVKFTGRGFRNKMLRKISWALRAVGCGIWSVDDVRESLIACREPVPSAPPEGLLLVRVRYAKEPEFTVWNYAVRSMVDYFRKAYFKHVVLARRDELVLYRALEILGL